MGKRKPTINVPTHRPKVDRKHEAWCREVHDAIAASFDAKRQLVWAERYRDEAQAEYETAVSAMRRAESRLEMLNQAMQQAEVAVQETQATARAVLRRGRTR